MSFFGRIRNFGADAVPYMQVCEAMEKTVAGLKRKQEAEQIWLLEHQPVYTYGIRTQQEHIAMAAAMGIPVVLSSRGGHLTFHGPGQRVAYIMIDLRARGWGVVTYIQHLQAWIIEALERCGIQAFVHPEHIGVWTTLGKVASVGVRVSGGVTSHGLAINVVKELRGFDRVVPCGLSGSPMSTLQHLRPHITLQDIDAALIETQPF